MDPVTVTFAKVDVYVSAANNGVARGVQKTANYLETKLIAIPLRRPGNIRYDELGNDTFEFCLSH